MARHEIVIKRVPKEVLDGLRHVDWSDQTVAAYRSRWGQQIKCMHCDEMLDTTGLDRLFEEWGPATVISVGHSWSLEPGDPRETPQEWAKLAED